MTDGGPFDDRLLFYLRNEDTIREWAAIRHDVRKATHQVLLGLPMTLEPALATSGSAGPFEIHVEATETNYPRIVVRRPSWPYEYQESVVGVCVEWNPTKVDPSDAAPPFYGIRVGPERTGGRALREIIRAKVQREPRFAKEFSVRPKDPYWPVMQQVPRSQEWWKSVDEWLGGISDSVVEVWPLCAGVIDDAVEQAGPIFGSQSGQPGTEGTVEPRAPSSAANDGDG